MKSMVCGVGVRVGREGRGEWRGLSAGGGGRRLRVISVVAWFWLGAPRSLRVSAC